MSYSEILMLYEFLDSEKFGPKMCTFLAKQLELQQFKGIKVSDSDLVLLE